MPRKDFRNDLATLIAESRPLEEQELKSGGEDGEVAFNFQYDPVHWLGISVHFQDLHLYPKGSSGVVYLGDGNTDQRAEGAAQVLESVDIDQEPLASVVDNIAQALSAYFSMHSASTLGTRANPIVVDSDSSQSDDDGTDGNGTDEDTDGIDNGFEVNLLNQIHESVRSLLLRDIRQLRSSGYQNVGYHTAPSEKGFILYVTIPIQSLVNGGMLTQDQCEAWNLDSNKYLVILMRFTPDYVHMIRKRTSGSERMFVQGVESHICRMMGDPAQSFHTQPHPEFRITTSDSPQVSSLQAFVCFRKSTANKVGPNTMREGEQRVFRHLVPFLSSWTLDDLLNNRLMAILAIRLHYKTTWAKAEEFYELVQLDPQIAFANCLPNVSSSTESATTKSHKSRASRKTGRNNALADDVDLWDAPAGTVSTAAGPWADHMNFPLLAIRYTLRRLINSSKHCLVCHKLITTEFEALKPYVCNASLCNHQYMQLGLGPSIEFEIIHEPSVVDLLVSLAYTASAQQQLSPFPAGIGYEKTTRASFSSSGCKGINIESATSWSFNGQLAALPGDVIEIYMPSGEMYKYTVEELLQSSVTVETRGPRIPSKMIGSFVDASLCQLIHTTWMGWEKDATGFGEASTLVIATLAKLPPIPELRATLKTQLPSENRSNEANAEPTEDPAEAEAEMTEEDRLNLEAEKEEKRRRDEQYQKLLERQTTLSLRPVLDQIDPLIYPLLRWIICSNRSFIKELRREEDKVTGIGAGHLQFKMVMSTPEKEEIFLKERKQWASGNAVQSVWGFHGSPLYNWHSILRTGLHTQKITHGRAYGNGIYHALDYNTSSGYASMGGNAWPNSKIGVTQCLSLNEIVNCPDSFVSRNPYLVIGNINWVQTRFLLVQPTFSLPNNLQQQQQAGMINNTSTPYANQRNQGHLTCEVPGKAYLPMDVSICPRGAQNKSIRIPAASVTVPDSRTQAVSNATFADPGLAELEREEAEAEAQRTGRGKRTKIC
ncbi:hypothetical protein HDU88_001904 [Geranomyces variabilis]|nr:hypothetical protein HDU88_001904 [Geranomyces variabilis]